MATFGSNDRFGFISNGTSCGGCGGCNQIIVEGTGLGSSIRCAASNTSSGAYASVFGKCNTNTFSNYGFIGGGCCNNTSNNFGTINGGFKNLNQGQYSFVGNGICNQLCNSVSGCCALGSVIVGGVGNGTCGGCFDLATCTFTVAPTICNTGQYSFIGGGFQNINSGIFSVIGGGCGNKILAGCRNNISWGSANIINNTSAWNSVSGYNNLISGTGALGQIVGGAFSCVTVQYGSILHGRTNSVSGYTGNIVGGHNNIVSWIYGSIVNGCCNVVSNSFANIVGGFKNLNQGEYSFVGNGICNQLCNSVSGCCALGSVIVGGVGNGTCGGTFDLATCSFTVAPTCICNTGRYGFLGGGFQNNSNGEFYFLGGGCQNTITSNCFSTIIGGRLNTINTVNHSNILGGCTNSISGGLSSIAGGNFNSITESGGFIGSGCNNIVSGIFGTVVAGNCNLASDIYGTVVGGCRNKNFGKYTFIGNGICNVICNSISNCYTIGSVVVGGIGNNTTGGTWDLATCSFTVAPTQTSTSAYSFIGGGFQNRISNGANFSNIGGGNKNLIDGGYSSIFGGLLNTISGYSSAILSGICNTIVTDCVSGILGGCCNRINPTNVSCNSFIGYGFCNTISNNYDCSATIVNGICNCISSSSQVFIGTGFRNKIQFDDSVIVGGNENCITAQYGAILNGKNAKAYAIGQHTNSNGSFNNIGDNQSSKFILWDAITIDESGTANLYLDGAGVELAMPNNTTWNVNVAWTIVVATLGTGTTTISVGSSHVGNDQFLAKNLAGTITISAQTNVSSHNDAGMPSSDINYSASGSNLRFTFTAPTTGGTATTYYVNAVVTVSEIGFAGNT
jgi:hypothetical protein